MVKPFSPRPKIHQNIFRREFKLTLDRPVASFTFDDFPKSAFTVGGALLRRFNVRGTYYASLGLMGQDHESQGPYFTRDDLDALIAEGHELACHTYSHLGARRTTQTIYEEDIQKNRAEFGKIIPRYELRNFSYPGGEVTLPIKRRMRHYAASSRGTYPGINRRWVDLDLLLCQNLYEKVPLEHVARVLEECQRDPGWIIFYGHDIRENPSPYGCTPRYLEKVLELVCASCRVVPICEVLQSGSNAFE